MGPFGRDTVRRLVTLAEWKAVARRAKDDPTAEVTRGLPLGEAIVALPGHIKAVKAVNDEARTVDFVVSDGGRDRDGDSVAPDGWQLANYRKNPVVLFGHDYYSLPVARAQMVGVEGEQLVATDAFATADLYPFADTVFRMLKGKFINAVSAGFNPLQWIWNQEEGGYDFAKQELFEHSVVPVPANAAALQRAIASGIDVAPLRTWAEETLDHLAGAKGLWLPRADVEALLKDLTGHPTIARIRTAMGKQGDGGTSGDDPTADEPPADDDAHPTGNGASTAAAGGTACPSCGAVNAEGAPTCASCGKPMKGAKGEGNSPSIEAPVPGGNATGGREVEAGEGWACATCNTVNDAARETCSNCGAARPAKAGAAGVVKGVVPANVSTTLAHVGTTWSAPSLGDFPGAGDKAWGDISDDAKRHIAGHYAWAKAMPPAIFGDLKLPHHEPKDGKVVWAGVANAMARLNQADIPSADHDKVYGHLAAHYRAFGKEPPDKAALAAVAKAADDGGKPCQNCGAMNPTDATTCAVCGEPMQMSSPAPTPATMDTTTHAALTRLTKLIEDLGIAMRNVADRLGTLERTAGAPAPASPADAVDRLLTEVNRAAAPATGPLAELGPEDIRRAVQDAARQAAADTVAARVTALTGRLPE